MERRTSAPDPLRVFDQLFTFHSHVCRIIDFGAIASLVSRGRHVGIKRFLLGVNMWMWTCGAFVAACALWANVDTKDGHITDSFAAERQNETTRKLDDDFDRLRVYIWALVVIGVVLMTVGFIGCCSAAVESRRLLVVYIVLLCVLAVVQTVMAGLILSVVGAISGGLEQVLANLTAAEVDKLQQELKCCGITEDAIVKVSGAPCRPQYMHADDSCFDKSYAEVYFFGCLTAVSTIVCVVKQLCAVVLTGCLISALGKDIDPPLLS